MSLAYACDREGCDTFQRTEQARGGWLTVHELDSGAMRTISERDPEKPWHFCSVDCLLAFFGRRSPLQDLTPGQGGVDTPR